MTADIIGRIAAVLTAATEKTPGYTDRPEYWLDQPHAMTQLLAAPRIIATLRAGDGYLGRRLGVLMGSLSDPLPVNLTGPKAQGDAWIAYYRERSSMRRRERLVALRQAAGLRPASWPQCLPGRPGRRPGSPPTC